MLVTTITVQLKILIIGAPIMLTALTDVPKYELVGIIAALPSTTEDDTVGGRINCHMQ